MPSAFSSCWLFRGHNASSILERNRFLFGFGIHDMSDILRSLLKSIWQELQGQYPGRMLISLVLDNWFVVAVWAVNFHVSVVSVVLTSDSEFCSFAMVTSESINSCGSIRPIYHFSRYRENNIKQHTATSQLRGPWCFVVLSCYVESRVFWCGYAAPLASSAPRTVLSWFRNSG